MTEQQFEINKIYTKDISAESPSAPEIYKLPWEPEINLNLGNNAQQLEEDGLFEVTLVLTVTATLEGQTAYVIEVEQAGIFTLVGFAEEQQAYMIGAMIPNILFPYARETISSLSQKAGFPPMLLNPIDFNGLFQQHLEERAAAEKDKESPEETKH